MKMLRFWIPVMEWMVIIFLFSSRQRIAVSDIYSINFLFFKTLHVIEFFFLYTITYRALKNTVYVGKNTLWIIAFIIVGLYAVSDEFHQLFVPTREGTLRDAIIDMFTGGFAWISLRQLLPKAPKKLKQLAKDWQLL